MSQNELSLTPTEAVVEKVNRLGLSNAAKYYCTSPSTLSRWLKAQQYKRRSIYMKIEKPHDY